MAGTKSRTQAEIVLVKQAGIRRGRSPVDNRIRDLLGARGVTTDRKHHTVKVVWGGSIDIELGGFGYYFHLCIAARKPHGEAAGVGGPEARQAVRPGKIMAGVVPTDQKQRAL